MQHRCMAWQNVMQMCSNALLNILIEVGKYLGIFSQFKHYSFTDLEAKVQGSSC